MGTQKLNIIAEDIQRLIPQKKRGAKRNILWMNEANEFTLEDYRQLSFRTADKIIMDYNPSDVDHWIYDEVIPRDDCTLIKSTYKDNFFLPQSLVEEIERLRETDKTYWTIYGEGERAIPTSVIYPEWLLCDNIPDKEAIYGIDFGFNNPTSIVKVVFADDEVYLQEELYESKLTNSDLLEILKERIPKTKKPFIYADSAEPARIEEIYNAGFNIQKAIKDVADGIDFVKRFKLHIHKESYNLLKEIKNYKWKEDKNGRVLDEPVKFKDHIMDAMRYAIYTYGREIMGKETLSFPSESSIDIDSITRNTLKGF